MTQIDFFESTAYKKLERLEKWMGRIQMQMEAIKQDLYITKVALDRGALPERKKATLHTSGKIEQLTMYGTWDTR